MGRRIVRLEHSIDLSHRDDHWAVEYRRLGCAVLLQGYRDGLHGDSRARHFLSGGPSLRFWCDLARLDITAVIERSAHAMRQADLRRRHVA